MAVDYGIRVVMDESEITADKVPEILRKVIQATETRTLTATFANAYAAGTRTYNVTINVGNIIGADVAFEILVDGAVSDDNKSVLLRRILNGIEAESLAITYATTYAAGAGSTNQVTLTASG